MVTRPILYLCLVLAALPCAAAPDRGSARDVAAVRKAFAAYRSALLRADGKAAARTVTRSAVRHYGKLRDAALYAPERSVRAMSVVDKTIVLRLRHDVPARTLQRLSPEAVLAYGVAKGWIGKDSVRTAGVGDVTVKGDVAAAVAVIEGQPSPLALGFRREGSTWKFDLLALMAIGNAAIMEQGRRQGLTGDQLVETMLAAVLGSKPRPSLWKPLLKR